MLRIFNEEDFVLTQNCRQICLNLASLSILFGYGVCPYMLGCEMWISVENGLKAPDNYSSARGVVLYC